MSIIKGLSKVGASYSIILDKVLMQLLNMTPETKVEIRTDGKSLTITPVSSQKVYKKLNPKVRKAFEASINKNHAIYKKLAERDSLS